MTEHSANPWVCFRCGKEHSVPSLARACESLHERQRLYPASTASPLADGAPAKGVPAASRKPETSP